MTKAERRRSWLGERTHRAGMAMGPRASAVLHVRAAALGGAKRPPRITYSVFNTYIQQKQQQQQQQQQHLCQFNFDF